MKTLVNKEKKNIYLGPKRWNVIWAPFMGSAPVIHVVVEVVMVEVVLVEVVLVEVVVMLMLRWQLSVVCK